MQTWKWAALELKGQWLWVSVLPIVVALIVGGYVWRFKFGDYEVAFKTDPELRKLPYVDQAQVPLAPSKAVPSDDWKDQRIAEYQRTGGLFLVHVCEPSSIPGQKYDITIFLMRHLKAPKPNQKEGFSEIEKLELYFGDSWGGQVFTCVNNGGPIGIRTSAWGSFLATGRVTFRADSGLDPLILNRYVDFEMAAKR